jgi:pyridoxamine 5'-phosphate oxidase-like protein
MRYERSRPTFHREDKTVKDANRKLSGALAWSPQVAMDRRETDEFLSGRWVARLATIGADGYPHVYPFWYYWDGECLYLTATRTRGSYRDLQSNPRCSVVVDMDDRPLMGMRSNMAKAVMITGDAEMAPVGSGRKITVEAGPWRGEYLPEQAVGLITSRYLLQARDGVVGTTGENFREMISSVEARDSQIVNDNMGRVFIKIKPRRIRAWDFSKAPIGWVDKPETP